MTREISNHDDIIDSREVIERLEELTSRAALVDSGDAETEPLDDEERAELNALADLASQGESVDDWQYGATLVRDSYFVEYAQELAEELGEIDDSARWPYTHIDWQGAARDLRMDYAPVDFDGATYWVR